MNSYWQLLRREGALPLCAAAFVARMPMAMYSLGTVLMITSLHGSYALAGGLAATGLAASAALLTRVGAWADRFGPRRVLAPQSAVFSAATAAFIACAELQGPIWLLFVTGTLGAAAMLAAVVSLAGLPSLRQSPDLQHPHATRELRKKDSRPATNDVIAPIDTRLMR